MSFTIEEYLMGRTNLGDLSSVLQASALDTVAKANQMMALFYADHPESHRRIVTSGYRRPEDNAKVPHPSLTSKHLICQAIDIEDSDHVLKKWVATNLDKLERIGLWQESPVSTPTWVHVQIVAPHSGNRVFNV